MPSGQFVGDDEDHYLMIFALQGDKERLDALTSAVRSFGIEVGGPRFFPGQRPVDDETYEEQRQRLLFGLTPDVMDVGAIKADRERRKKES